MVERGSGHIVLKRCQAGMVPNWVTEHVFNILPSSTFFLRTNDLPDIKGPYTPAKAAVHALGTALYPEAKEHGVGVTTIIMAGTLTDIIKSERSRPERYKEEGEGPKASKKREARRIAASDVAEVVVRGVKEDQQWVATHPKLKVVTESYFMGILEAYDRAGTQGV